MSFNNHDSDDPIGKKYGKPRLETTKKKDGLTVGETQLLLRLINYSDRYEINVQFWEKQVAVYIAKDGIDLKDFGGDFDFAVTSSVQYLDRINRNDR